jgi:hypothetical protein
MHRNARIIQFDRGTTKIWRIANQTRSEEWNESLAKESGINEELERIQLSSGEENDRNCKMRGKEVSKFVMKRRIRSPIDQNDSHLR